MIAFKSVITMQGFDRHQSPPWQMVPVSGQRFVALTQSAGLTVTSLNPAVATVTEVTATAVPAAHRAAITTGDRVFQVSSGHKGTTRLQAKNAAGVVSAELEVTSKNAKVVQLSFNFVKDSAGHKTRRVTSQVANWIRDLNTIYQGQANITFNAKSNREVTAPGNLGRVVRFSSHLTGVPAAQHEWAIVTALGDTTADMNLFFVWEYEQDATPLRDATDAGTLARNCIFEDGAGVQTAETLGHEIGHYLGCPDHYVLLRKRELMYGITDQRGQHLPKQDVDIMNP